ncbi:hypothetical protein N0V94_009400 [Neodidymelliopsis sp. IMI 364377]|nr:hypothetical protein N0V94_009400 [Neodidymelliopsis sp. IMI 364377]
MPLDWPQGDEAVWYCGDGNYCCSRDDSCCGDSNVQKTNLGVPTVVAIAGKTTPRSTTTRPSSTATTTSTSNPSDSQSSSQTSSLRSTPVPIAVGIGVGGGVFLFLLIATGCWYLRRRRRRNTPPVLHELSATTPAISHASPGQNYAFDDKAGGWTSSPSSPWSRRVSTGRNSNIMHEAGPGMVQTSDKRIELHSPVEYTEMPGYNPPIEMQGMAEHKGLARPELAVTEEQRRLSEARRSRFVEGVETETSASGSRIPINMSASNTVATEGDVEGLQRRLRELGR